MDAKIYKIGLALLISFCFSFSGYAQPARSSVTAKVVEGEISGMGKDYIAIVYKKEAEKGAEYEILLPLDDEVKLVHKKNLKELNIGDRVNIEFDEIKEANDSKEKVTFKSKKLSFVSPAEKKPVDTEELNLKGIKNK